MACLARLSIRLCMYFSESISGSSHIVNLKWIFDLGEMLHNVIIKKFVLLVVLLNSELYYNFFVIIFFLPLLQDSVITWQNNFKLVLLNFLFDLIGYIKFFNNIWHIQNAHELHIKICFINIVYCIFYICSGVYRVSLF